LGVEARFGLHGGRVLLQLRRSCRSVANGGDDLTQVLHADVTRGIDAVPASFLIAVGYDVALRVELHLPLDQIGVRSIAREHEHPE